MLALFLLVTALCWYGAFRWRRRRLYELAALVPGPPELPLIGHAHKFSGNTQDVMKTIQEFSCFAMKNDGYCKVWIGPILYFALTDPIDLEFLLKTCLEKDDLHRFVRVVTGYGGIYAPVSIWRRRRKIMAPTFSPRVLEQFVEIFAEQSDILSRRLAAQRDSGPISAWPFLSAYSLDSVCESAMGVKIGAQKNEKNVFLNSLNKMMQCVCNRIFHLWLHPNWLYRLFPEHQELNVNTKILHNFTDEVIINKRKELQSNIENNAVDTDVDHAFSIYKRKSFLELLISRSGGTKEYSNIELREESFILIVAGTDTSAAGLGYTLTLLAKYPDVQEKVYQELCDVFGKSDRKLEKEDLPKLLYMERVIKESLRLFPPVPIITRKIEKQTVLPSGRILPAGAGVVVSLWGVLRDPAHWGPDADHFDPDRFLPERFRPQHACSYIPFSSGPRNCLGYQYSMISLKTALATVLRRCRIVPEPEKGPVPHIDVKFEIMMKPVNNFQLRFVKRL